MNLSLTLLMALPLLGAAVLAALPKANALLAKQIALGSTFLVALVTIAMAVGLSATISIFNTLRAINGFHPLASTMQLDSMEFRLF